LAISIHLLLCGERASQDFDDRVQYISQAGTMVLYKHGFSNPTLRIGSVAIKDETPAYI